MRDLIFAAVGSQSSVALDDAVNAVQHFLQLGVRSESESDVVEGLFHVIGSLQWSASHPENAESLKIGNDGARRDRKNIFRRQRNPDDLQLLASAVDDSRDLVSRFESVRFGERLVDDDLIVPAGFDEPSSPQIELIEDRLAVVGDRDEPSGDGVVESFHFQVGGRQDTGLRVIDSRDLFESPPYAFRRPLQ